METALLVDVDGSNRPALARGLTSHGITVHGTTSTGSVSRFSRHLETVDRLGVPDPASLLEGQQLYGSTSEDYVSVEEFRERLVEIARERDVDVVLPYREEHLTVLSSMRAEVEDRTGARVAVPDHEDALDAVDKVRTFQRAEEHGLTMPRSYYPTSHEDVRSLFDVEDPPIVAKPSVARGGGGLAFCETPEEAVEAFDDIEAYCQPLFQECVTGRDYIACTVADRDSEPVAAFVAEEVLLFHGSYGGSICSISRRNESVSEELLAIPEAFDWIGPAAPEYIVDEETGEAKLMEINPRMFGHTSIAIRSGVNVPYLYDRVTRGLEVEPVTEYRDNLMWWDPWNVTRSGQIRRLGRDLPRRYLRRTIYQNRYPPSDPVFGLAMLANDVKQLLPL